MQVIYTSAILKKQADLRQQEYLSSLEQIRSFGLEPWIIESMNIRHSFFDQVSKQVLYPNQNQVSLLNKGVNEAASMRASISQLPFQDDDMVVKLTGRYYLKSSKFIDLIKNSWGEYEAYGNFGKHFVGNGEIFTGCFAMRWDLLKEFLLTMNFKRAEEKLIPIEKLVAEFMRKKNLRVFVVNDLDVSARVFFSGEDAQHYEF